jgi:hypothetical protein
MIKGRIKFLIALSLIIAMSTSMVAPALAETQTVYYSNSATWTILEVPNQPKMEVYAAYYNLKSEDGPGDHICLWIWSSMLSRFMPVAIITTSSERAESVSSFFKGLLPETRTQAVNPWDIQIYRCGKNLIVCWFVPIKGTISGNAPSGTPWTTVLGVSSYELPPGCIILQGYGDSATQTTTGPFPSSTIVMDSTSYNAKGNFICPAWRYCGSVSSPSTVITSSVCTWIAP